MMDFVALDAARHFGADTMATQQAVAFARVALRSLLSTL